MRATAPRLLPMSDEKSGAAHVCTNGLACPAQLQGHIEHFVSRGATDIVGLGSKTVEQLIAKGLVKDLADIYQLTPIDLARFWLEKGQSPAR